MPTVKYCFVVLKPMDFDFCKHQVTFLPLPSLCYVVYKTIFWFLLGH